MPGPGELGTMRRPETIEKLYLDFDGFFASVMQQAMGSETFGRLCQHPPDYALSSNRWVQNHLETG